jgi:ferric-dicitrate binding protein FerR (iron transport regulator)
MNAENTYYELLMSRYFSGEASGDEISELSAWLDENLEHKEQFTEQKKIFDAVNEEMIEQQVDLDAEWEVIRGKISSSEEKGRKVSFAPKETKQNRNIIWRVAASVTVLLAIGVLLRFVVFRPDSDIKVVASNDVMETRLPDGSQISLNQGSSITYPKEFAGNKREVELEGEAHFQVTHDASKPFIVSAGDLRVEVLGTSFYINTHAPGGKVQVILIEGSVAAYYKDSPEEKTIMKPGEQVEFSPQTKEIASTNQHEQYFMVWKTRSMKFENERLDRVIYTVSRAYNKKITLTNPAAGNCRLTVAFEGQTLESVLKVLETTLDLKVTQRGDEFLVDGKVCE